MVIGNCEKFKSYFEKELLKYGLKLNNEKSKIYKNNKDDIKFLGIGKSDIHVTKNVRSYPTHDEDQISKSKGYIEYYKK